MSQTILNSDELHSLETRVANHSGKDFLMLQAGKAVASSIRSKIKGADTRSIAITFLAGPGNNGGDALAAACELKSEGFDVVVVMPRTPSSELSKEMLAKWKALGGTIETDPYMTRKAHVVVDGLFGTGLNKPITGDFLDCVLWYNERQAIKISIDIPSGLNFITGNWIGSYPGCRSNYTATMLCQKAGLYMNEGVDAAGEVELYELDVSVPLSTIGLTSTEDFEHITDPRSNFTHKGSFGKVLVVGGDTGKIGAPILSARAALIMGAGAVTVESISENAPAVDIHYPELMWAKGAVDTDYSVTVLGPGLGKSERAKERVKVALASPNPLVLDADALNIIADDIKLQDILLARRAVTILTPHEMEAARLLRREVKNVSVDRISAARELAVQSGAIVVLKGAGTVVALRSSLAWVNPTGDSHLSSAGSGDVLSGMIASLLAQKFDVIEATLCAVYMHGVAGSKTLRASQIAEKAREIIEDFRQNKAQAKLSL